MDLYNDGWCIIIEKNDGDCFYVDGTCSVYFEFSKIVALYIIKRLKENLEKGYNLIDYICRKRGI